MPNITRATDSEISGPSKIENIVLYDEVHRRLFGEASSRPLIGRFLVLRLIGSGGMSLVYEAYDAQLDRHVAIKMLNSKISCLDDQRKRVLFEAQAMAQLSHPNVVQVYEIGEYCDHLFIVMQYIEGSTLQQWLAKSQPRLKEILKIYCQAGTGLIAAHDKGCVHRDFKPTNVLVTDDHRVLVSDFGLARFVRVSPASEERETGHRSAEQSESRKKDKSLESISNASDSHHRAGTPAYMSPEQQQGHQCCARSDQYSFCLSLLESLHLANNRPFAHDRYDQASTTMAMTWLPAKLCRILAQGLQNDPNDRWPDMRQLVLELEKFSSKNRIRPILAWGGTFAFAIALLGWLPHENEFESECDSLALHIEHVTLEDRWKQLDSQLNAGRNAYAQQASSLIADSLHNAKRHLIAVQSQTCAYGVNNLPDGTRPQRIQCLKAALTTLDFSIEFLQETNADMRIGDSVELMRRVEQNISSCMEPDFTERLNFYGPPSYSIPAHEGTRYLVRAQIAEQMGHWQRAEAELSEAKQLAEQVGDDQLEAYCFQLSAQLARHTGDYQKASEDLKNAIELAARHKLNGLFLRSIGDQVELESSFRFRPNQAKIHASYGEALASTIEGFDDEKVRLALKLASFQHTLGQTKLANETLTKALDDLRSTVATSESPLMVEALLRRAEIQTNLRNFSNAIEDLTRASNLQTALFGNLHPEHVRILNLRAMAFRYLGEYAISESLVRQAMDLASKVLPPDHPQIADSLGIHTIIEYRHHRYDQALEFAEQALHHVQNHPQSSPARIAETMVRLATVLNAVDRSNDALKLYNDAHNILQEKMSGPHRLKTFCLLNSANILTKNSDFAVAEQRYRLAIANEQEIYGNDHSSIVPILQSMSKMYRESNEISKAENAEKQAIELLQKQVQLILKRPDPPLMDLDKALVDLVREYMRIHDLDSALATLYQRLKYLPINQSPLRSRRNGAETEIITTLTDLHRYAEIREFTSEVLDRNLQYSTSPDDHTRVVMIGHALAQWQLGSKVLARHFLERAIKETSFEWLKSQPALLQQLKAFVVDTPELHQIWTIPAELKKLLS